jgi:hypothetical protein
VAILKPNEIRSLLKIGHFNKTGIFNKGVSGMNGKGGTAQEVLETFL